MKKGILAVGAIGVIILITTMIARQVRLAKMICANIIHVSIDKIGLSIVRLTLSLEIKNPSKFDIKIIGYNLAVYVNGKYAAAVRNTMYNKMIKPQARTLINLKISANPKNVFGNILTTDMLKGILNKQDVEMRIAGNVSVDVSGLDVRNYPIDIRSKLSEMTVNDSKPC